jgi:Cys-tRNA(Pro)/Cys-tRNA(Cys) deacylase
MAKNQKLNSMRVLEANDIPYEVFTYDTSIRDAQLVAEAVGFPEWTVYKTLVVEVPSSKKPVLVMLASNTQLNLKRLAKSLGEKKVAMAKQANAEKMTGLQVGGISALALMQKNWDVYLDKRGSELQHIVISAGQRGTQIRVGTLSLIQLLRCKIVDIADEVSES